MRAILIEDEQPSLALLERMIRRNEKLSVCGAFTDPEEGLAAVRRLQPDVVFTDIVMPGMNGMELARKIREFDDSVQIVFITAHENFALDAFHVNAVNYILKPMTEEDLNVTINRLVKARGARQSAAAPETQRIRALGELQLFGAPGQAVRWPTVKTRELFACFLPEQGRPLEKWQLCERLWPGTPPDKAAHRLHSTVNLLNAALGQAEVKGQVGCDKSWYRLDAPELTADVWELRAFLRDNPMVEDGNIARFERALSLYRGDLFGLADYEWCLGLRERLRRQVLDALRQVGRYYIRQGSDGRGGHYLRRLLQTDPLDEEAAAMLMRLYARAGRKQEVASCYAALCRALKNDLGIGPSEQTERVYRACLQKDSPAEF